MFEHRKRAGLTQRQLADHMGVDFTYISKIEADRTPPPALETIERAASALNLNSSQRDELLLAAERLPSDVAQLLVGEPKVLQLFRTLQESPDRARGELVEQLIRRVRTANRTDKSGG
jgi:HTH-type transcriptional regulator, competence development regulator